MLRRCCDDFPNPPQSIAYDVDGSRSHFGSSWRKKEAVVCHRSLSAADPMAVHVSLTALCTTMQHHTSADCAALRISLADARRENADLISDNADLRRDEKYMRDRARTALHAEDSLREQRVSLQTTLQTTCGVATKYLQRYRYSKDEKDLERALRVLAPSSSSPFNEFPEGMRVQLPGRHHAWDDHASDDAIEGIIEEITTSGIAKVRTANEVMRIEVERLTPVDLVIVNRTEPMGGQQHFLTPKPFQT